MGSERETFVIFNNMTKQIAFLLLLAWSGAYGGDTVENILDGRKQLEAQFKRDEGRLILVWKPEIENPKEAAKYKWFQDATKEPYKFFAKDLDNAFREFEKIAADFNKCIEKKPWPQKSDCLRVVDYCFGKESALTCEINLHSFLELGSNCGSVNFKKCLKSREVLFDLYSQCFNLKKHIGFAFYPYGVAGERREYIGIRVDGSIDDLDKYRALTCDFSLINNKLTVIGIQSRLAWDYKPEHPYP